MDAWSITKREKGMSEEPAEVGLFMVSIRTLQHRDGRIQYQTSMMNKRVPTEIIIMQLKAFLANVEKDYFDNFNETIGSLKGD